MKRPAFTAAAILSAALLAGCHGRPTHPSEQAASGPSMIHGQVSCDYCRVHYFDGAALKEAALSAGEYVIPATALPFALFIVGPQQVPHVSLMRAGQQPEPVRLAPREDRRGGYLAGVVMNTQMGGKQQTRHGLEPVVGAEVVITLGHARQAFRTDGEGRFIVPLPANTYRVFVKEQHWDVTVARGDTAMLPIVVGRTLID